MDVATPMVTLKVSHNKIKSDDLPLKKAKKQGEMPFPILSPIPFINCTKATFLPQGKYYTFTKSWEAIARAESQQKTTTISSQYLINPI